jgi:hypothetical protein
MNSNSYSITAYSIPCNTDSYYNVITITAYQTSPKVRTTIRNEIKWKMHTLVQPNGFKVIGKDHLVYESSRNSGLKNRLLGNDISNLIELSHLLDLMRTLQTNAYT